MVYIIVFIRRRMVQAYSNQSKQPKVFLAFLIIDGLNHQFECTINRYLHSPKNSFGGALAPPPPWVTRQFSEVNELSWIFQ